MAVLVQQKAQAFGPGANMWIVPEKKSCSLVRKIDWYLGFHIEKSSSHVPQELSVELQNRLREESLTPPKLNTSPASPLLIVPQGRVSAELVVSLPGQSSIESWLLKCNEVWSNLGKPTLKIFLPDGVSAETFKKTWPKIEPEESITIVVSA